MDNALKAAAAGNADRREVARAKINLALHVVGRRADGYRLIETLAVFTEFGDVVAALPSEAPDIDLATDGPFAAALADAGAPADNLVTRAAAALAPIVSGAGLPATRLELTKRLPVAAGLGGGSADAAATLRLLNRCWGLGLDEAELAEIGARLGADVPMCLASRPLVATGVGERIASVGGLPPLPVVLACPPVAVSTAAVFAVLGKTAASGLPPLPPAFATPADVASWLGTTRNDLGVAATAVSSEATAAATALAGDRSCLFARMSGSGAAAFGIFASSEVAEGAAARLAAAQPTWWVVPTFAGAS